MFGEDDPDFQWSREWLEELAMIGESSQEEDTTRATSSSEVDGQVRIQRLFAKGRNRRFRNDWRHNLSTVMHDGEDEEREAAEMGLGEREELGGGDLAALGALKASDFGAAGTVGRSDSEGEVEEGEEDKLELW